MSSPDRMLPFLKPIEDLLVDPAITEVMVNVGGRARPWSGAGASSRFATAPWRSGT